MHEQFIVYHAYRVLGYAFDLIVFHRPGIKRSRSHIHNQIYESFRILPAAIRFPSFVRLLRFVCP